MVLNQGLVELREISATPAEESTVTAFYELSDAETTAAPPARNATFFEFSGRAGLHLASFRLCGGVIIG